MTLRTPGRPRPGWPSAMTAATVVVGVGLVAYVSEPEDVYGGYLSHRAVHLAATLLCLGFLSVGPVLDRALGARSSWTSPGGLATVAWAVLAAGPFVEGVGADGNDGGAVHTAGLLLTGLGIAAVSASCALVGVVGLLRRRPLAALAGAASAVTPFAVIAATSAADRVSTLLLVGVAWLAWAAVTALGVPVTPSPEGAETPAVQEPAVEEPAVG